MKKKSGRRLEKWIEVTLPCGETMVATRRAHQGQWMIRGDSAYEADDIDLIATNENVKAIKDFLDAILENTPSTYRSGRLQ